MSPIERKVVPLHALPASALLERYGRLLADPDGIGTHSALVPAEDVALLQRELRASLRPAMPHECARAAAALIGSFAGNAEGLAVFSSAMTEELAEYPPDVLHAAIRRARRRSRSLPSIAEMIELCEEEIEPRRRQLRALERMAAEHEHRRQRPVRMVIELSPAPVADNTAAPSVPPEEAPLDDWQLAVQELRRLGASNDEVASFTERLMSDAAEIRAEAEAQQQTLAAVVKARAVDSTQGRAE